MPEHKIEKKKKHFEHLFFFVSWDYALNQHHAIGYHSFFYNCTLFKRAAIILAILGQKTLHWQLSKVIPSGMSNCNLETIN